MFGFFFGTACLIGLAAVVLRGHHHHHHHPRGHGWRRGPRRALYAVFSRLDTTPGQEKAILAAVDELTEKIRGSRGSLKQTREAAAGAVRGDRFDEATLAGAFTAQDAALSELRGAVTAAGRKIHEVLDDRQRRSLADLIESGPRALHLGSCAGHC